MTRKKVSKKIIIYDKINIYIIYNCIKHYNIIDQILIFIMKDYHNLFGRI